MRKGENEDAREPDGGRADRAAVDVMPRCQRCQRVSRARALPSKDWRMQRLPYRGLRPLRPSARSAVATERSTRLERALGHYLSVEPMAVLPEAVRVAKDGLRKQVAPTDALVRTSRYEQ